MEQRVVPQQEHKSIKESIDLLYIETVRRAADLQTWQITRVGPVKPVLLKFYNPFVSLFRMTYKQKDMERYDKEAKSVSAWMYGMCAPNYIPSDKDALTGIALFDTWQAALFTCGLLSMRK